MKYSQISDVERSTTAPPERPAWLDDEQEVLAVLHFFLNKLDKQPASERARMPSYKFNQKNAPKLYNHDEISDRTWSLIQSLSGLIYQVRPDQNRSPYDADYVGASLVLIPTGEEVCRAWLSRPFKKSYKEEWKAAVDKYKGQFADNGVSLKARPVRVSGQSAKAVVSAFARIYDLLHVKLTLRQLSARCFWGHSKVLDAREDLLLELFPDIRLSPRPVIVQAHLPEICKGVLFIENQDTYIQALAGIPEQVNYLTVVYVAGFRGSAERIRAKDGVSLHYHGGCDESLKFQFESWWYGNSPPAWPVWFWGDLDYSGMAILKALRRVFGNIQAWPVGYALLMKHLSDGGGHSPDMADKVEQIDPGETGCAYADEELLKSIRIHGRFVDQEIA